jgi:hypothetical protein
MNKVLLAAIDAECRLFLLHKNIKDAEQDIIALNKLTKEYIDKEMTPPTLGIRAAEIVVPRDRFGG